MGLRREGREAAVQCLYQLDLSGREFTAGMDGFWALRSSSTRETPAPKLRAFAEQLVAGVTDRLEEIDERIRQAVENYELGRISAVDRNILRVGIYEMLYSPEVPPVVCINEAIEIAKRYGNEESGRFVNGILDRIRGHLSRSPRESFSPPAPPAPESAAKGACHLPGADQHSPPSQIGP